MSITIIYQTNSRKYLEKTSQEYKNKNKKHTSNKRIDTNEAHDCLWNTNRNIERKKETTLDTRQYISCCDSGGNISHNILYFCIHFVQNSKSRPITNHNDRVMMKPMTLFRNICWMTNDKQTANVLKCQIYSLNRSTVFIFLFWKPKTNKLLSNIWFVSSLPVVWMTILKLKYSEMKTMEGFQVL